MNLNTMECAFIFWNRYKQRVSSPPVGLATPKTNPDAGELPHPDPLPLGEGGRRPGEGITGVRNGLKRKTARRVTLKSFVNNPEIESAHVRMPLAIEQALAGLKHPSLGGRGGSGAPDTLFLHISVGIGTTSRRSRALSRIAATATTSQLLSCRSGKARAKGQTSTEKSRSLGQDLSLRSR